MLPVVIGSICGLVFMPLGYQFTITCIEMIVIEGTLLAFMIYEKQRLKANLMKDGSYLKVGPKHFNS